MGQRFATLIPSQKPTQLEAKRPWMFFYVSLIPVALLNSGFIK